MRFILFFCGLLILLSKPSHAEENSNEEFNFYLKNTLGYENSVMLNSSILEIQAIIEIPLFTGTLGVSRNNFSKDIATNLRFTPYKNQFIKVGFNPFFHGGFFTDIGHEINVGSLAFIDFAKNENTLKFAFEIGILYKFTFINLLPKPFRDFEIIFSIALIQPFLQNHEISLFMASYEDYYYPLFLHPSFHVKYIYTIHNTHSIGIEAFIRYTDMLTVTGTVDGFQLKAFYSLKLPL